MSKLLSSRWTKVFIFALCLVPLLLLLWHLLLLWKNGYDSALTANPIEYVTHKTGDWIIRFLLITLCVTPLRKLLNQPKVTRYRRMLGLFAFFYGCLHLLIYLVLDQTFSVPSMIHDIAKRPFITMGMLAWLCLFPLALTSTQKSMRMLGRNWVRLHRLVYLAATAGAIHFYWLVKRDKHEPLQYLLVLGILLASRIIISAAKTHAARLPKPQDAVSATLSQ
jgi:sulfoxide reductase heme-binding subunit YedZ